MKNGVGSEVRQSQFEWIEVFYIRQRRHSYLDYMSPDEYERYNQPLLGCPKNQG